MDSLEIKSKKEIVMWTDKKKFIELGAMGDSS